MYYIDLQPMINEYIDKRKKNMTARDYTMCRSYAPALQWVINKCDTAMDWYLVMDSVECGLILIGYSKKAAKIIVDAVEYAYTCCYRPFERGDA